MFVEGGGEPGATERDREERRAAPAADFGGGGRGERSRLQLLLNLACIQKLFILFWLIDFELYQSL